MSQHTDPDAVLWDDDTVTLTVAPYDHEVHIAVNPADDLIAFTVDDGYSQTYELARILERLEGPSPFSLFPWPVSAASVEVDCDQLRSALILLGV